MLEGDAPYLYRGSCHRCATEHRLVRSPESVAAARRLLRALARDERFGREGKMLGVLVGEDASGGRVELAAFSGRMGGLSFADGFVGPTRSDRLTAGAERATLSRLTALGREIDAIDVDGARRDVLAARAPFDREIAALEAERRRQKRLRTAARAETLADGGARELALVALSQREGGRIRALKRRRRERLAPLERELAERVERRARLRAERRTTSRVLQAALHASHGLIDFKGRYATLEELFSPGAGIPTGAGECCAPKLLHEAALRGIRPTGLAEFWYGPPPAGGGREHGRLYPACADKCAPLLGHLLCGLHAPRAALPVLYEDRDLVVVDKPPGLLSVPGRTAGAVDSVESRLALLRPRESVRAAHRLDQATSGVLVLARHERAERGLRGAFERGDVTKEYRARVAGRVDPDGGEIRLPLRADPTDRPRQVVDHRSGRPASTRFVVVRRSPAGTDLRLHPTTGRTHQLRIHCASGLGAPIVGDALYGGAEPDARLLLHAHRLSLPHPTTGRRLSFEAPLPDELR